jgi:DNA-binding transcriptional ArsR family regulator
MQPLYHPPVSEITVQGILHALSDPVRVRIFAQLAAAECPKNCSAFCQLGDTPLPKSSLSQHFKILREAGLIRSERKGVELQSRTRCSELEATFGPLVEAIITAFNAEAKKVDPRPSTASSSRPRTHVRRKTSK